MSKLLTFLLIFFLSTTITQASVLFDGQTYSDIPLKYPDRPSCGYYIWWGVSSNVYANHLQPGNQSYNDTCQEVLAQPLFLKLAVFSLSGLPVVRPLPSTSHENTYRWSGSQWVDDYWTIGQTALKRSEDLSTDNILSTFNLYLETPADFNGAYNELLTGQPAGFLAINAYSEPTPTPTHTPTPIPPTPTPTPIPPTPTPTPIPPTPTPTIITPVSIVNDTFSGTATDNLKTIVPIGLFSISAIAGSFFAINKIRSILNI